MKCYVLNDFLSSIKKKEVDLPVPHAEQVLLKVKASGICHSDIHLWEGYYDIGMNQKLELKDRGIKLPLILGHEVIGQVVSKGIKAENIKIDSNYIVYPWIGCGVCENCILSQENYCANPQYLGIQKPGGFAEYILVPHYKYLINIGNMDPATIAQYACSGLTTYSAIKKIDKKIYQEKPVIIFGSGGLGLMTISILKALGAFGCIVIIRNPNKREAVLNAGALEVFNYDDDFLESKLIDYNKGNKYSAVIDLVGNTITTGLSFNLLEKFGTLVIIGMFGGISNWPLALIPMKALKIIGSYVGNLTEFHELMTLVLDKKITPVTINKYNFDNINQALFDLKNGKIIGRAVLVDSEER